MATNPEEEASTHVSEGPVAYVTRTVRETVVENPRSWRLAEALLVLGAAGLFATLTPPLDLIGVLITTLLALLLGHPARR